MNPILLTALLVLAFVLGVATEEVTGKSKLAQTLFFVLYIGELLLVLFFQLFFFSSIISSLVEIFAICLFCEIGMHMVTQKRRINELEELQNPQPPSPPSRL
jgi:hypothetical protein